jgi:hypothetical protein
MKPRQYRVLVNARMWPVASRNFIVRCVASSDWFLQFPCQQRMKQHKSLHVFSLSLCEQLFHAKFPPSYRLERTSFIPPNTGEVLDTEQQTGHSIGSTFTAVNRMQRTKSKASLRRSDANQPCCAVQLTRKARSRKAKHSSGSQFTHTVPFASDSGTCASNHTDGGNSRRCRRPPPQPARPDTGPPPSHSLALGPTHLRTHHVRQTEPSLSPHLLSSR